MTYSCTECGDIVIVPINVTQFNQWRKSGNLIQNEFPHLTNDEREIMISGTCGKCFDKMFGEKDDLS